MHSEESSVAETSESFISAAGIIKSEREQATPLLLSWRGTARTIEPLLTSLTACWNIYLVLKTKPSPKLSLPSLPSLLSFC